MPKLESFLEIGSHIKRSPVDPCYLFTCWPRWKAKVKRVCFCDSILKVLQSVFCTQTTSKQLNILFVCSPSGVGLQSLIQGFFLTAARPVSVCTLGEDGLIRFVGLHLSCSIVAVCAGIFAQTSCSSTASSYFKVYCYVEPVPCVADSFGYVGELLR